jgi:hypothetical protein
VTSFTFDTAMVPRPHRRRGRGIPGPLSKGRIDFHRSAALDDAPQSHPEGRATVPRMGRAITLADLAIHTSGLPRLPDDMEPADLRNPYADGAT